MEVADTPGWATGNDTNGAGGGGGGRDEESSRPAPAGEDSWTASSPRRSGMETTPGSASPRATPSSERSFLHKVYNGFKIITVLFALLLFIAQIVSVVYLPFDGVELVLKIILSSFTVLIALNELECWGMLRNSPLMWHWVPRGYFYAFIGIVSVEENDVKELPMDLAKMTVDAPATVFIETASWMMFAAGVTYVVFGMCCGQRYLNRVKGDYTERVEERKRIFEVGLRSDNGLSKQMIS